MPVINCTVDLLNPALVLDQPFPIVKCEHNVTRIEFTRTLDEYTAGVTVDPHIGLIFRKPNGEELEFTPTDYLVTEYGSEPEPTPEPEEPTEEGEGDEEESAHYWEETYAFNIPRILTEHAGRLTLTLCYIWLGTVTVDGTQRTIIAQEWNSSEGTLTVSDTLHTYGVISLIDPTYVMEYDDSGTIVYLTSQSE